MLKNILKYIKHLKNLNIISLSALLCIVEAAIKNYVIYVESSKLIKQTDKSYTKQSYLNFLLCSHDTYPKSISSMGHLFLYYFYASFLYLLSFLDIYFDT